MARILVAEDDIPVRAFIRRTLEARGHEVTVVGDGAEAILRLSRHSYDLLLADIVMPNMDGVELALKVARDWPDLPLLLMSGYAIQRQRGHGLGDLAKAVLQKPFTMVELNHAVEQVLRSREPA